MLNPFSVYPTKEVSVSGAYGGSRYTKSSGSTFVRDILKSQHSNITFCIKVLKKIKDGGASASV